MFSNVIAFPGSISRLRSKVASASAARPCARVGDAERVQRVEIRLGRDRLLQQLDRRGGLTGFAQVGAELNLRACGRRARGKGVAQRGNRAGQIADAPEIEGEMTRRRHHVGPRGEDLAVARDPLAQLALVVERHRLVHQPIDLDQPLRIVLLAVVRLRRAPIPRRSRASGGGRPPRATPAAALPAPTA